MATSTMLLASAIAARAPASAARPPASPTAISAGAKAANPRRSVRRLPRRATSAAPAGRPVIAPASSPRMPSASAPADRSSSALMAGIRVAHAAGSQPATKNMAAAARRAERSREDIAGAELPTRAMTMHWD
jgi:hypothetical protein